MLDCSMVFQLLNSGPRGLGCTTISSCHLPTVLHPLLARRVPHKHPPRSPLICAHALSFPVESILFNSERSEGKPENL
ncbi:Uncharacterized protein TCM_029051 [Theobroma cacao]|uniref:Uncharacterized protein n=1 Tax=Theobroma cacao TaxID=3641 RepID=A0A061GJ79_THECC|nr:Uncharacterized protein TCM_029051 [Theobroma cacao]